MPRKQSLRQLTLTVTTTEQKISTSSLQVLSVIFQSDVANTDFVAVGPQGAENFKIAPKGDYTIRGDNLDIGTSAYLDLSEIYIVANSGTQTVNVQYLVNY